MCELLFHAVFYLDRYTVDPAGRINRKYDQFLLHDAGEPR